MKKATEALVKAAEESIVNVEKSPFGADVSCESTACCGPPPAAVGGSYYQSPLSRPHRLKCQHLLIKASCKSSRNKRRLQER